MDRNRRMKRPTIGIVTALPKEFEAVVSLIAHPRQVAGGDSGAGLSFVLGELPSRNGHHAVVVLLLPDTGNNNSSIGATLLTTNYPTVRCVFMVGIAGGIPNPSDPAEHVRLGDVVVSGRDGVVQYDIGKMLKDRFIATYPPRPPSARMLQATRMLSVSDYQQRFHELVDFGLKSCGVSRPPDSSDILYRADGFNEAVSHPRDSSRILGRPRIFIGSIASANQVLKNAGKRDQLRDEHCVKAVEMEGSGIADAAWTRSSEYFIVRGICDYCDANKRDDWQAYAAVVAAAYTRVLLSTVPSESKSALHIWPTIAASLTTVVLGTLAFVGPKMSSITPLGRLYVRTDHAPVELRVDGRLVKILASDLPFTSLELREGQHDVLAAGRGFRYHELVQVKPGQTAMVTIPADSPLMP